MIGTTWRLDLRSRFLPELKRKLSCAAEQGFSTTICLGQPDAGRYFWTAFGFVI